jgi:hypothetical protein
MDPVEWQFHGREKRKRKKEESSATLRLCPEIDYMYCSRPSCAGCPHDKGGKKKAELEETPGELQEVERAPIPFRERPPEEKHDYEERIGACRMRMPHGKGVYPGVVGDMLTIAAELGNSPMWVYRTLMTGGTDFMVNVPLLHEIARQKNYKAGWVWIKRKELSNGR